MQTYRGIRNSASSFSELIFLKSRVNLLRNFQRRNLEALASAIGGTNKINAFDYSFLFLSSFLIWVLPFQVTGPTELPRVKDMPIHFRIVSLLDLNLEKEIVPHERKITIAKINISTSKLQLSFHQTSRRTY